MSSANRPEEEEEEEEGWEGTEGCEDMIYIFNIFESHQGKIHTLMLRYISSLHSVHWIPDVLKQIFVLLLGDV